MTRVCAAALALLALTGCTKSIAKVTGAAAGITTGVVSSNPAVGVAVGVGVSAATDAVVKKVTRTMTRADQDAVSAAAAKVAPGDQTSWRSEHFLGIGNQQGQVRVMREIGTPIAACREILFSLSGSDRPRTTDPWFVTQVCKRGDGVWKWAAAEPAVARWGFLQ